MNKIKLLVRKSNKYIAAQLADSVGRTLGSIKAKDPKAVGEHIAQIALKNKIDRIVFDRGSHRYHGQVKLLADAARAAGLKF
jgi:large subunit ribosomal protein L18